MQQPIPMLIGLVALSLIMLGCSADNQTSPTDTQAGSAEQRIAAEPVDRVADRVRAAFNDATRPAADAEAHANRKPDLVLEFLGVHEGMTTLDVIAGGGYYTENLAAAVGPSGKVYMHNPERVLGMGNIADTIASRLDGRLPQVQQLTAETDNLGLTQEVDLVTMVNVFHDIYNAAGAEAALGALQSIHTALKPGGVLGLIDHVGTAGDNTSLHRMDPDAVRQLLRDAGFVIEAESDIHLNLEDDYSLPVFDESVRGKTHRFVIKARKLG